jgi:hypothetical protein
MEVLFLTIFLSFLLALFFLFFFVRNLKATHRSSPEQSALIPFRDDEVQRGNHSQPAPRHPAN